MLPKYYINLDINLKDKLTLLDYASKQASDLGFITNKKLFYSELVKRENEITTAIGKGVAFPHGKIKEVTHNFVIILRLREAIDFNSLDGAGVKLFFIIGSKEHDHRQHLNILQRVAKGLMQSEIKTIFLTGDKVNIASTFEKLFRLNIGIESKNDTLPLTLADKFPNLNFYQTKKESAEEYLNISDYYYKIDSAVALEKMLKELENLPESKEEV